MGYGRESKEKLLPLRLARRLWAITFQTASGVLLLPGCRQIEMDSDNQNL